MASFFIVIDFVDWDETSYYGILQIGLLLSFVVQNLVKTYFREMNKRKGQNKLKVLEKEIEKTDTLLNHLVPCYVL